MMNEKKIIEDLVKIGKTIMIISIVFAILIVIGGAVIAEEVVNQGGSGITSFISYLIIAITVYICGYAANVVLNWRAAMLKHTMKK